LLWAQEGNDYEYLRSGENSILMIIMFVEDPDQIYTRNNQFVERNKYVYASADVFLILDYLMLKNNI
jgi:hypothetical protein